MKLVQNWACYLQDEEYCEEEEYHGRTNGMDELDRENMESYRMETSEVFYSKLLWFSVYLRGHP